MTNEIETIQNLFNQSIEDINVKTIDQLRKKVFFTGLMLNKNATTEEVKNKQAEWIKLFDPIKHKIIDCIKNKGIPFFQFWVKESKVLLVVDISDEILTTRFEVYFDISQKDLKDFRMILKQYISNYTQIHSQLIESAIPALIENTIPEFQNEEGEIIEAPEKIFNVWAENFPAIVDLVRFFRINKNKPNRVKPIIDSFGDIAGYFLHFDTITEINPSVSNSGKKYDILKRQIKALTEKSSFIIRKNIQLKTGLKSKITGGMITSLVKSIKWSDEDGRIRIEISDLMVLFDKAELRLRSLPTDLRLIWEQYGQRKAHHCKAFLWCIHNMFSTSTISKDKFLSVCGLHEITRKNNRELAFQGCLDFLLFTNIVLAVNELENGLLMFNFNKFMIPHMDKNKSKLANCQ